MDLLPVIHLAAHCATKGAVHALTRAMACDHGPEKYSSERHLSRIYRYAHAAELFGDSGDIETLKGACVMFILLGVMARQMMWPVSQLAGRR